jgi:single-strand DNA-binding protein
MNKSILIGRITKDLDLRYTTSNMAVLNFTLAVDRRFKQEGQPSADFISCIAFGKLAETIQKYCFKGLKIAVIGHIQTRSWEKDGKKNYVTEVIVDEMEFVEPKRDKSDPPPGKGEAYEGVFPVDDDGPVPF